MSEHLKSTLGTVTLKISMSTLFEDEDLVLVTLKPPSWKTDVRNKFCNTDRVIYERISAKFFFFPQQMSRSVFNNSMTKNFIWIF